MYQYISYMLKNCAADISGSGSYSSISLVCNSEDELALSVFYCFSASGGDMKLPTSSVIYNLSCLDSNEAKKNILRKHFLEQAKCE